MKDYYKTLGLQRGAPLRNIKRAYRDLVKKWHPDFHPDDPRCVEKMQEINEAYEMLGSRRKRLDYDKQRTEWESPFQKQRAYEAGLEDHPFDQFFGRVYEMFRKDDK